MLSGDLALVAYGEVLNQLDVARQSAPREGALQQVVAQDGILRNPVVQNRPRGIDVVKTLSGEATFPQEVLISV
jgi:hypothetical protein